MDNVVQWLNPDEWVNWDTFAKRHVLGSFVHTSAWKSVIEQSFPHIRGMCCTLQDTPSGNIRAGIPIFKVTSRLLGTRLVSIPFATLSDPLVADSQSCRRLLEACRDAMRQHDAQRIEIRCSACAPAPPPPDWSLRTEFKHHVLPLDRTPEDIFAATHPRAVRAMISKACKAGLDYREDTDLSSLDGFYSLFLQTRKRLSLPPIPRSFFLAMHRHLVPGGHLSYARVERNGGLLAAGIILSWNNMRTIEYLGDRTDCRSLGTNQLLYWGAITEAIQNGQAFFSFGRTSASNTGLLQYKRRWGTVERDLMTYEYPATPPRETPRDQRGAYRLVSRLCRFAPMPFYRMLGHFCYRHMG